MNKQPKIMTDFDNTLIIQNSLNILTKKTIRYFFERRMLGKLIPKLPILWIRFKELYKLRRIIPNIIALEKSDYVIEKAKKLNGVPYMLFTDHTVPYLKINPNFIEKCLYAQKKYKLFNKKITIVTRNGIDELNYFFDYQANLFNENLIKNIHIKKRFEKAAGKSFRKKIPTGIIKNKDVLNYYGIKFDIIANKICKKLSIVDNKKGYLYTGVIKPNHEIGVIEMKNKAILYENNIVIADREETIYKSWAEEFIAADKNS